MANGPSLYESLTGHIDGEPLDCYDERTQEVLSVMENVKRILNTRAGSLEHLPDYGLTDLTNIYRTLPASAHLLKTQIERTVLAYEPRIARIELAFPEDDDPGLSVAYIMTCHLKNAGLVHFGTHFEPAGRIHMRWRRS